MMWGDGDVSTLGSSLLEQPRPDAIAEQKRKEELKRRRAAKLRKKQAKEERQMQWIHLLEQRYGHACINAGDLLGYEPDARHGAHMLRFDFVPGSISFDDARVQLLVQTKFAFQASYYSALLQLPERCGMVCVEAAGHEYIVDLVTVALSRLRTQTRQIMRAVCEARSIMRKDGENAGDMCDGYESRSIGDHRDRKHKLPATLVALYRGDYSEAELVDAFVSDYSWNPSNFLLPWYHVAPSQAKHGVEAVSRRTRRACAANSARRTSMGHGEEGDSNPWRSIYGTWMSREAKVTLPGSPLVGETFQDGSREAPYMVTPLGGEGTAQSTARRGSCVGEPDALPPWVKASTMFDAAPVTESCKVPTAVRRAWDALEQDVRLPRVAPWNLVWTRGRCPIDPNQLHIFQMLNHFPDSRCLTQKDILYEVLRRARGRNAPFETHIIPLSFVLPREEALFRREYQRREMLAKKVANGQDGQRGSAVENVWILKPTGASRGVGIQMIADSDRLSYKGRHVIQEYISNPALIRGVQV